MLVITYGALMQRDLLGLAHVAVRTAAGNGCKCAQLQCFIHMQQLLFVCSYRSIIEGLTGLRGMLK